MSLLDEIRKQPQSTREIMFALCVVTTISLIGLVWFHSFRGNLYALLEPEDGQVSDKFFAENGKPPSIFANLSGAFSNLRANVSDMFQIFEGSVDINGDQNAEGPNISPTPTADRPYILPVQ